MTPVLFNNQLSSDPTVCDTIIVELHEATMPYGLVATATSLLHTDGSAEVVYTGALPIGDYYIAVRHRNAIETWSKDPVTFNAPVVNFDFTSP